MSCKCPSRETFDINPLGSGTKCGITVRMVRANIPQHDCWITVTAPWGVVTTDERVYVGDSKKYNDGGDYDYIKVWFMRVQDWKYRFGVCYKTAAPPPPPPPDPAEGEITNYEYPSARRSGERYQVEATGKNIGGTGAYFRFRLFEGSSEITHGGLVYRGPGNSFTQTLSGTMPNRNLNLRLELRRQT